MNGTETFPKFYDIDGDIELLEFCVSLFSVDQSVGTFLTTAFGSKSEDNERLPSTSSSSYVEKFMEFREKVGEQRLEEQRNIRWMESVPKPALGTETAVRRLETVDGDELASDERSSALSHRIFTVCHSESQATTKKLRQSREQSPQKDPIQNLSFDQRRQLLAANEESMRVMAYLGSDHNYDPSEEYLLWELRMLNGRRLASDWDLDQIRTLVSAKTGKAFKAQLTVKEPMIFDEIREEGIWENGSEVTGEDAPQFEVPEQNDEYWLHYMVEIGRGIGFVHDNLRVEWTLELPKNCQCLTQPMDDVQHQQNGTLLNGITQRCAVKSVRRDDVANFGYPIEFMLNYGPQQNAQNSSESMNILWPKLLFTVTAEDNWGRIYVEGCAVFPLPISFEASQRVWIGCARRVEPMSKMFALRETHLGHAGQLERLKSFLHEGMATESSGKLEITVRCVHQSRHYISGDLLRSLKYSKMMRRIGISGELQCRIAKVLEEFARVRRQLIKVRSGPPKLSK